MPKTKTNSTNRKVRYSAEQVISALMDDDSSSCYSDDTDTKSEKSEQNESPPAKNLRQPQRKQYAELQPVRDLPKSSSPSSSETSTSEHHNSSSEAHSSELFDTESPSPVNLETNSDTSLPPSSNSSTYSTHSAQTFLTDNSTSSNPSPKFPEDTFSDIDSDDDSIKDFQIDPKSETVNKKRALFHVAEIPFDTLCQMVKTYLQSIETDPTKPEWPVPDMDRNQKRNFRKKTEKFKIINDILKHQHVYVDEKNQTKRGELFFISISRSITILSLK